MKLKVTFLFLLSFFLLGLSAQKSTSQDSQKNREAKGSGKVLTRSMVNKSFTSSDQLLPTIRDVKISKIASDDKASIKLTVDSKSWSTQIAYQLLLDADKELYDFINDYGTFGTYFYENCEYKIPTDANSDLEDLKAIYEGSESITVPEGAYDLFITSPDPGMGMIFVAEWENREQAMSKGFYFKAGYEYHFYIGKIDIVNLLCATDLELSELIVPEASDKLTASEEIKVRLTNTGTDDFTSVQLSYQLNNGDVVTETYDKKIASKEEVVYTFNQKADLSKGGVYTIEAWLDSEKDMNQINNKALKYTKNTTPFELPFNDDFDNKVDFLRWTILDNNEDAIAWNYNAASGADQTPGYVFISAPWFMDFSGKADDYLILDPVALNKKGAYHFSFFQKNGSKESFRVLYGKTSNPSEMEVIADYREETGSYWKFKVVNFEVEEPGSYYFAIHYNAHQHQVFEESGINLSIDKVLIDEGIFVGIPDLVIEQVFVPAPSCDLSSEVELGVKISNKGTEPVKEFKLTYDINRDKTVTETFTEIIDLDETITVYFKAKADLSETIPYDIDFSVSTENEENTGNNGASATTIHYEPVMNLPFENDFSNASDILNWNSQEANAWSINDYAGAYMVNKGNIPLLSRCLNLAKGSYKFSYNYMAGNETPWGSLLVADYQILYGKVGAELEDMTVIKSVEGEYTFDAFTQNEFNFEIKENDDYIFAIVFTGADLWAGFYIKTITIDSGIVGLEEVNASSTFAVYPNPVDEVVKFELVDTIESVKIYDASGKLVYNHNEVNRPDYTLNVKEKGLNRGVYFVIVQTETGTKTSKMLVK